jgi:hypothetical protein
VFEPLRTPRQGACTWCDSLPEARFESALLAQFELTRPSGIGCRGGVHRRVPERPVSAP